MTSEEFVFFWRRRKKVAIYVLCLRLTGTKAGMCEWPRRWNEKILRVVFFPWKAVKNQLWWMKRGEG